MATTHSRSIEIDRTLSLSEIRTAARPLAATLRDVLDLTKPRITAFVVFTAAMGLWLAPARIGAARGVAFLLSTALLVGAANILNCWIERDTDARMRRTRNRPLPAGRIDPWSAAALAVGMAAFALPALALTANRLTAFLGLVALVSYVLVYTPLKRVTPRALEIGAVPGAIPPLMGWAAATGEIAPLAWALFGILFFWQLPHFLAIAIRIGDDYERGGIRVLPVAKGDAVARAHLVGYSAALLLVSAVPSLLGCTGRTYPAVALTLGTVLVALSIAALRERTDTLWARRTFLYSLLYLAALLIALVLDAN